MALTCRALGRNFNHIYSITKPVKWSFGKNYPIRVLSSTKFYKNTYLLQPAIGRNNIDVISTRKWSSENPQTKDSPEPKKKGLIHKFKEMYRDYWYVVLPVHLATSTIWFGSFYYIVRSGFDVIGMMQAWGVSETILSPLKESGAGYFALAFALYKIVTPLRYAVTVGATTFAIRRLTALGWIKPVPSRERIKEMLQEKKDNLQDRFIESRNHYQSQMKEKSNQMLEEMRRYKSEVRNMKNKPEKK